MLTDELVYHILLLLLISKSFNIAYNITLYYAHRYSRNSKCLRYSLKNVILTKVGVLYNLLNKIIFIKLFFDNLT